MVKRKAEECLDCWIERGAPDSQDDCTSTLAIEGGVPTLIVPTAEQGPVEASSQPSTPHTTDVADLADTSLRRFWLLLERAGYEVW